MSISGQLKKWIIGAGATVLLAPAVVCAEYSPNKKENPEEAKKYDLIEGTIYPDGQNWERSERQGYYFTSQGSKIIPYDWAMALPGVDRKGKFFTSKNLSEKYGYIAQKKSKENDDALPVGFMKDPAPGGFGRLSVGIPEFEKLPHLGINCAACHTSELSFKDKNGDRKNLRIDGGVSLSSFQRFINDMDTVVGNIATNDEFYKQFEENYFNLPKFSTWLKPSKEQLKQQFDEFNKRRQQWQKINNAMSSKLIDSYPEKAKAKEKYLHTSEYGPARNDAFGVIFNQTLSAFLGVEENARVTNAPVKYPMLWDAPAHDLVQWVGIARNSLDEGGPIARNTGQVLGVFGHTNLSTESVLGGSCTSAKLDGLKKLEGWVETLRSPIWPIDEIGNFDPELAKAGRDVYVKNCQSCHQLMEKPENEAALRREALGIDFKIHKGIGEDIAEGDRLWREHQEEVIRCQNVKNQSSYDQLNKDKRNANECLISNKHKKLGTDNLVLDKAFSRTAQTGILKGEPVKPGSDEKLSDVEAGIIVLRKVVGLSILGSASPVTCDNVRPDLGALFRVVKKALGKTKPASEDIVGAYKARPLNGIWASAPYLHNGSVRSLSQMLTPPDQREKTFKFNCNNFDPVNVGIDCENADPSTIISEANFIYDTTKMGNSNKGHLFGTNLEPDEKEALIEYLKTL